MTWRGQVLKEVDTGIISDEDLERLLLKCDLPTPKNPVPKPSSLHPNSEPLNTKSSSLNPEAQPPAFKPPTPPTPYLLSFLSDLERKPASPLTDPPSPERLS